MNTHSIEGFLDRYNKAVQSRSKEIRLQLGEAGALAHEITMLLSKTGTLSDKVIELQDQLIKEKDNKISSTVQIDLDGGHFS